MIHAFLSITEFTSSTYLLLSVYTRAISTLCAVPVSLKKQITKRSQRCSFSVFLFWHSSIIICTSSLKIYHDICKDDSNLRRTLGSFSWCNNLSRLQLILSMFLRIVIILLVLSILYISPPMIFYFYAVKICLCDLCSSL